MASKIEVFRQFKSLGINVQEDVLNCAVDMCGRLFIDERELVETWIAYSLSHLSGAKPSVELLLQMERKEFLEKTSFGTPKRSSNDTSLVQSSQKKSRDTLSLDQENNSTPKRCKTDLAANQFSPATVSSEISDPSPSYAQRQHAGECQITFGNSSCDWKSSELKFNVSPYKENTDWKSMHISLLEEHKILQDHCKEVAEYIAKNNKIAYDPDASNEDDDLFVGRVFTQDDTKLSANNVTLLGPDKNEYEVDVSAVSKYSLFPGQVALFRGTRRGKNITASELFTSGVLPQIESPPDIAGPLQMIIASGPFTPSDSLSYEPLQDLVKYVKTHQPHLFFVIGPIIDSKNSNVTNGSMSEAYSAFYEKILTAIQDSLKGTWTKFYLVSSGKDACGVPIYPTMPAPSMDKWKSHLLPDPCLLNINGVILSMTSTDVLLHLGKREISNAPGNRLVRLAHHLIQQQNLYPLYPPEKEVGFDLNLWYHHARLPLSPHILITPSELHHFVKEIDNVITINPERITKGSVAGTFACVEVKPSEAGEKWSTQSNIAAKIIKI